jgi:hypothetical protein
MKYEIFINDRWVSVDEAVFRSWTGPRVLNNQAYYGPRFVFGTKTPTANGQILSDLCLVCGNNIINHRNGELSGEHIICWNCENSSLLAKQDAFYEALERREYEL